ncbi:MAG: ABC transporter substrate-binding protein [Acidobacteriota bacterium]
MTHTARLHDRAPRPRPGAVAITLLLAVSLAGAACADGGEERSENDRIRAIVLPYLTLMPFHIAAEEGYFAEAGLEVEFVRMTGTLEAISAVAQGQMDVVSGMLTANVLNAMDRGARLRLVQSVNRLDPEHCTSNAFVVRREHLESGALADPERIRELRWDADLLLPHGYWIDELLAPWNLTVDDLDLVSLPEPAAVEALINDRVDVTVVSEPFLSLAEADDETATWRATKEIVPDYELSVMMFGPRLLEERPELGERFVAAMLRAVRQYARGETPRNLAIVREATGLSAEQLEAACLPAPSVDGRIDPASLMAYQEWSARRGLTSRVIPEEELVDHRFIDAATAALAR